MNKFKIAKSISTLTNPPILCIPLFLIICILLSHTFNKFMTLEIISIIFTSILPMTIIVYWAKKLKTDGDISNRTDRYTPLIVGAISYFTGFIISLILKIDYFLTLLLLCYSINTAIVCLITTKWKISIHTTGLSGPVAALILLTGKTGAILGMLYPILVWSRVLLKKHTLSQAITGGVQGFFLTILEMYMFITLFNIKIIGLTSLSESILYILAIITTPVIISILSYTNKSKNTFIIVEILCLTLFLMFIPINISIIFITISLETILISYFAGNDFVWNEVLIS